jgi:hypothetical protein
MVGGSHGGGAIPREALDAMERMSEVSTRQDTEFKQIGKMLDSIKPAGQVFGEALEPFGKDSESSLGDNP